MRDHRQEGAPQRSLLVTERGQERVAGSRSKSEKQKWYYQLPPPDRGSRGRQGRAQLKPVVLELPRVPSWPVETRLPAGGTGVADAQSVRAQCPLRPVRVSQAEHPPSLRKVRSL